MGNHANILLVSEGFDRIEAGGAGGGVEASSEADDNGKGDCAEDQPPGNGGNVHAGKILPMKVEVCAEGEGAADEPAKEGAENPADQTHYARFHEEKLLDVAVCGAESLQDADFAAAVAIAAKARRGLGVHDTHDAQTQFPRNDGETAGRRFGVGSGAGVCRIRRERLALGVAEGKLFAEERGRLRIELFGELALQDGFVSAGAGIKGTLHAVKGTARFGGFGHAGNHGGEWLAVVANFREKTNLGKDFDDVGKAGDFLTRAFVEETRLLVQRGRHGGTAHAAKIHSRGPNNTVEHSPLPEAVCR